MVLSVECREFVKSDLLTQVIPIIHDGVDDTNLITNIINFLVSEFLVQIFKLFLQEKIIIFIITVLIISLDITSLQCSASFSV